MKTKIMIAIVAIGFFSASCGESEEKKAADAAQLEETQKLSEELDGLNAEIEELTKAEEDVDATINELDNL